MPSEISKILDEEIFSCKSFKFQRVGVKTEVVDNQMITRISLQKSLKPIIRRSEKCRFTMQRRRFLTLTEAVSDPDGWHLTLQFMLFYIVIQAPLRCKMPAVSLRNRLRQGEKKPRFHRKKRLFSCQKPGLLYFDGVKIQPTSPASSPLVALE